jgi:hypothetical protein
MARPDAMESVVAGGHRATVGESPPRRAKRIDG